MSCPRCGATVPAQARFCAACGTPLDGDAASMATVEERTVVPTAAGENIAEAVVRPSSPSGSKSSSSGWLTSSDSISHGRFPPGAILDGRYRIIGLLGRGGMGIGGSLLARKNLRQGCGDHRGALRLASSIMAALWMLWLCQAHFVASTSMLAIFLLAIVTTIFYGALFWAIYLALEPFVRRYWPQTLVSWTTVLGGRLRDPIVGRDVLFGVALGIAIALLVRSTILWSDQAGWPPLELLLGLRSAVGEIVMHAIYAVRTALLVFFLLFLFRILLRNQWAAAFVFALIFGVLDALDSQTPLLEGATSFLYFGMFAVAVLRWGLTTLTIGVLVADLLLVVPASTDSSAWYLGGTFLAMAIPVALATWAFFVSMRERLWKADLLT